MQKLLKLALLVVVVVGFATPVSAQWSLFVVEPGGSDTSYATLGGALATAATFAGGPHKILVKTGTYNESGLTVSNVDEIYGDPAANLEDIVFSGTGNFLLMDDGLSIHHMMLSGYSQALRGAVSGVAVEDMIIEGASGTGVNVSGWNVGMIQNVKFSTLDYGVRGTSSTAFLTVQNCTFDLVTTGLDIGDCDDGVFQTLGFTNGTYGIRLRSGSHPNTINSCTMEAMGTDGIRLDDANAAISGCLIYGSGGYAVRKTGTTHTLTTVFDNCFYDNAAGTAEAYNDVVLAGAPNGYVDHNYYGDDNYTWDGAAGTTDANPWLADNSASGPATVEVFDDNIQYSFDWTIPACAVDDSVELAAYEFTVSWDPTKLEYVSGSAAYDEDFFGPEALYTDVDEGSGTLTFAAADFEFPGIGSHPLAYAEFNAINTGTTSLTISSSYVDENGDPLSVSTTPLTVTIQDTEAPSFTIVTESDPIGDDTYSDGSTAGSGPFVELYVEGEVEDNYALNKVHYRFNSSGGWSNVASVSGTSDTFGDLGLNQFYVDITALSEGSHTLNLRVRDQSNNEGFYDYAFNIDRTGPTLNSILVLDDDSCAVDPEYTNDPTVEVWLDDDGSADQMEFFVSGWEGPIGYDGAPAHYTLASPVSGTQYTVYARLYDKYNNRGNQTSDKIWFDNEINPAPSLDFTLAGGAAKTNTPNITADVGAFGTDVFNVEHIVTENSADIICGDPGWMPLTAHNFAVTLSSGDGVKTVYWAARDKAGNISAIQSDDIELDETAPDLVSFSIADPNGYPCADNWTLDVTVAWTDADVDHVDVGSFSGGPYTSVNLVGETSPYTFSYSIPGGTPPRVPNGDNTVYGVLVDDIGNSSAEDSDVIFIDRANPAVASIELSEQGSGDTDWSQSAVVDVTLAGFDTDIVEVKMGEVSGTYTVTEAFDPNDPVVEFGFAGSPSGNDRVYLVGVDCSGRMSAEVSDVIKFDLVDPVISNVQIDGGATETNSTTVSVDFTHTESFPDRVLISEDPAFANGGTVDLAWSGGPPYTFTLSTGDGTKTVYVKLIDQSERESAVGSDDILLDQTDPTGSFVVQQDPVANPFALAGYTNSLSGNEVVSISADGDVVEMKVRNGDGSSNTGWIPLASSYSPWTLVAGGDGVRTVEMNFKDGAGNQSGWLAGTIIYDATKPAAPSSATSEPSASMALEWVAGPQDASYILRYNFANEYPHYVSGVPPHPANMTEGLLISDTHTGTTKVFDGPHPDLYAVSIWARDSAGNVSNSPNTDVVGTNYILGDFYDTDDDQMGPDGCLDKLDEFFGGLGLAYNTISTDPNYNPFVDIAPTNAGTYPFDYPIPDDAIGFSDLIVFGVNFAHHRCGLPKKVIEDLNPKAVPPSPVVVDVGVPSNAVKGGTYPVPVSIDYIEPVLGYHVVLDFNMEDFELVSITKGTALADHEEAFFYYDQKVARIDVSVLNLDTETPFTDGEQFVVHLRAKNGGSLKMEPVEMLFRDVMNRDIKSNYETTVYAASSVIPTQYSLMQNYPNPFNPSTTIEFNAPIATNYTLTIYNILGQSVQTFSGHTEPGRVSITWNAAEATSGIYLYRVETDTFKATRKMVLLK